MVKPWMNSKAVSFYDSILEEGMKVLEFGAGNSTVWLSMKKVHVLAFEHQRVWRKNVLLQADLDYAEVVLHDDYFTLIADLDEEYDIIVIDGVQREKCYEEVMKRPELLKKGGYIIFDDSQRRYLSEQYARIADDLEQHFECTSIANYDYENKEQYEELLKTIMPNRLEQTMFCFKKV